MGEEREGGGRRGASSSSATPDLLVLLLPLIRRPCALLLQAWYDFHEEAQCGAAGLLFLVLGSVNFYVTMQARGGAEDDEGGGAGRRGQLLRHDAGEGRGGG